MKLSEKAYLKENFQEETVYLSIMIMQARVKNENGHRKKIYKRSQISDKLNPPEIASSCSQFTFKDIILRIQVCIILFLYGDFVVIVYCHWI